MTYIFTECSIFAKKAKIGGIPEDQKKQTPLFFS